MNLFEWSIPFVCEKITEMLYNITMFKGSSKQVTDSVQEVEIVKKSTFNYISRIASTEE